MGRFNCLLYLGICIVAALAEPELNETEATTSSTTLSTPPSTTTQRPVTIMVQKCCPNGEKLDSLYNCINGSDKNKWFPKHALVDKKLKPVAPPHLKVKIDYLKEKFCHEELAQRLTWIKAPFQYVIDEQTGNLIETLKGKLINTFSPSSYCVDALQSDENEVISAGVLCPCVEKTCIRKCCPITEYYNASAGACQEPLEEKGLDRWKNESFYVLRTSIPNCLRTGQLKKKEELGPEVEVFKDGSILTGKEGQEQISVTPDKYCLDMFNYGDRIGENALYCLEVNLAFDEDEEIERKEYIEEHQLKHAQGSGERVWVTFGVVCLAGFVKFF